jgi:hypothetical protein
VRFNAALSFKEMVADVPGRAAVWLPDREQHVRTPLTRRARNESGHSLVQSLQDTVPVLDSINFEHIALAPSLAHPTG